MVTVVESGMEFGPFDQNNFYHIESCSTYRAVGEGVKIAEFCLLQSVENPSIKILVVEAKSSTPKPDNPVDFGDFISDICAKFVNSFGLLSAIRLGRLEASPEFPALLGRAEFSLMQFLFILVVNGHEAAWLPALKDAIDRSLSPFFRVWSIKPNACIVLNDQMAVRMGLVSRLMP